MLDSISYSFWSFEVLNALNGLAWSLQYLVILLISNYFIRRSKFLTIQEDRVKIQNLVRIGAFIICSLYAALLVFFILTVADVFGVGKKEVGED